MRELKFRTWNGEKMSNPWSFADLVCNAGSGGPMDKEGCSIWWDGIDDKSPIMQFTGLKDKNEVEIYEGDIWDVDGYRYLVEWHIQAAIFRFIRKYGEGRSSILNMAHSDDGEVIGNIYENPVLLVARQESKNE